MFFNERFEFVEEGSTALRVSQPGDGAAPLILANLKAPKNGYAFIYLSNENDDAVYFDDFTVSYTRGRIIEENHYYAFGLRISGISSRKYDGGVEGSLKNDYLYQGDFAELDEDIGWHDFELRNYDAQIGRWIQQDPFQQFASPYVGMGNDPVNLIDPSGGIAIPCPGTSQLAMFFMKAGETISSAVKAISGVTSFVSVEAHIASAGAGIYNQSVQFKIVNRQLSGNETRQVGMEEERSHELGMSNFDAKEGNDDSWNDLFKSDLKRYYLQQHKVEGTENELGDEFEDIFESYINNSYYALFYKIETKVRRYYGRPFLGGDRNTKPDFIGDVSIVGRGVVEGSDWFELKQKSGGLYLSSNEGQIRGHIDNLKRSTAGAYAKYSGRGYKSKLWVITTADVNFSPSVSNHARVQKILYEHIHAEYRIRRGKWEFRFIKTISR